MYKMVLIDDEELILQGLKSLIPWSKYEIEIIGTANNGKEGLKLIEREQPDIVITDMKMPLMTGLEMIENVNSQETLFIILSGFDDFKLVKKGIRLGVENYLLKPVDEDELISTIEQCIFKIKQIRQEKLIQNTGIEVMQKNILSRLAFNKISFFEFEEKSEIVKIPVENNSFSAVIINNKDKKVLESFKKIISSQSKSMNIWFDYCDYYNQKGLLVIFSCERETHNSNRIKILKQWKALLTYKNQSSTGFCMGRIVDSPNEVHISRETAEKLYNYQILYSEYNIINYNDFEESFSITNNIFFELNPLFDAITSSNKNEVENQIEIILNMLKEAKNPDYIHNKIIKLMIEIDHWCFSHNKHIFFLGDNGTQTIETILSCYCFDEMKTLLVDFCFRLINIFENKEPGANPVIERIVKYIHDHFSDDISLKKLGIEFNLNSTYLGTVFKKEMGINFKNYVNEIRIAKACSLLKETTFTSSQIAYKCGFEDPNYFSRVFKKYNNISPSEYRLK